MGNRGTTPSWDDEMIEQYGLFGYFNLLRNIDTRRSVRPELEQKRKEILILLKYILKNKEGKEN